MEQAKANFEVKPLWRPDSLSANLSLPEIDGEHLHYECSIRRNEETGAWQWLVQTRLEPNETPCNFDNGEAPTMEGAKAAVEKFLRDQLYWL
jgi:hypothetical protein